MMGEDSIDVKKIINKVWKYWYLFAIIFSLFLFGGFSYLRHKSPVYEAEALLLIKDEKDSGQLNEEAIFDELGLGKKNKNLENEIIILKSSPLMRTVVQNLELQYIYEDLGGVRAEDLYKKSPVRVLNWEPRYEDTWFYAELQPTANEKLILEIKEDGDRIQYKGEFGSPLKLPFGTLTIARTETRKIKNPIGISIIPTEARAKDLAAILDVERTGEESSILYLSIKDVAPVRARDIIMELIKVYNQKTIDDENHVYKNTIDLINERIKLIGEELTSAERSVEVYKRQFNMMELSSEGSLLMSELNSYQKQISTIDVQLEILSAIEDFLEKNRDNFEFVPSNLSINNLTLTTQLSSFNQLLVERDRLKNDLGPSHPDLLLAQKQIQNLRGTIIENIQAIKSDLQINHKANEELKYNMESRLRSLPRRERELVEMERQNSVTENLYLYLLQKREESAISLSVTVAKGSIVEPAGVPGSPLSPNPKQIWLIAAFLGLAIPSGLVLLIESFNDKINEEDDIEQMTKVPVIGAIGYKRSKDHLVVAENNRTLINEMFRLLRTNMNFLITEDMHIRSVLVTSSISGEGKSFLTLNYGMTLALAGKKVLILELDLRRPKQEKYLQLDRSHLGIVNYLIDSGLTTKAVIRNSGLHKNLDLITSGPIPPNPSELILSGRLRGAIEELKENYDLILIDAPPIGMVSDAFQLHDLVDTTLYVVRFGYTRRAQLQIIQDIAKKDKLPRPFIILNAVPIHKRYYGYSYAYSYGYGYNYSSNGYYNEDKKGVLAKFSTNFFSKFLS